MAVNSNVPQKILKNKIKIMSIIPNKCSIMDLTNKIRIKRRSKMRNIGTVRRLDELGRITLPMEIRNNFEITDRDSIHIYVEGGKIILEKFRPSDIFSDETEELIEYKGKYVSKKSILELERIASFS